LQNKLTCVT